MFFYIRDATLLDQAILIGYYLVSLTLEDVYLGVFFGSSDVLAESWTWFFIFRKGMERDKLKWYRIKSKIDAIGIFAGCRNEKLVVDLLMFLSCSVF